MRHQAFGATKSFVLVPPKARTECSPGRGTIKRFRHLFEGGIGLAARDGTHRPVRLAHPRS